MFGLFKKKTVCVITITYPKEYKKSPFELIESIQILTDAEKCTLSIISIDSKKKKMSFSISKSDLDSLNQCVATVRLLQELEYSDFKLKFTFKRSV